MSVGLPRCRAAKLEPHSPIWAEEFARERDRIVAVLGDRIQQIEHVGSTAIPGVCAKPIIDIAIAVATLDCIDALAPAMAGLGYDYPGDIGIPGERIFYRGAELQTHVVHALAAGSTEWRNYVQFRDALRTNPTLAARYDSLKDSLAGQSAEHRAAYTLAKSDFIAQVLRFADPMRVMYRLVPVGANDEAWLERLRRAVYAELFNATFGGWDEARHLRQCTECWARGEIAIVETDGARVGMIQLLERPDAIEIGEIEIEPRHQNRGIGSQILRDTIARAQEQRRSVLLSVGLKNERAQQLYRRLGFQDVSRSETHYHMARHATH